MATSMTLIQTKTVGAGGASSIEFTSIPQTFTDLMIVASIRNTGTYEHVLIGLNGSTANFSGRYLSGYGNSGGTASGSYARYIGNTSRVGYTANTFGSTNIYIPNYTSANYKSISAESVGENNNQNEWAAVASAHVWSNTSAITSIQLTNEGGSNLAEYSTASLYGITKAGGAFTPKATGGTIYSLNDGYIYHAFTASGTFTPTTALTADILVVAGGGAGGESYGAGGGGGGLTYLTNQSLTTSPVTVTVGAGGVNNSTSGSSSAFGATSTSGGGLGGATGRSNGASGGSGGGGGFTYSGNIVGAGGAGTAGQGNAGGNAAGPGYPNMGLGGGGGAGSAGSPGTSGGVGGSAGNGLLYFGTYYAGGGAGNGYSGQGSAGTQGGTAQNAAGAANTGAGGGGDSGRNGGSGVVIVRYAA